jgi:hypothetical protein
MKTIFTVAALLSLAACGAASKPDARINQIRVLHQQVLAQQKPLEQTEQNPVMLRYGHVEDRQRKYNDLVKTSQEIVATVDQFDAETSVEPDQAKLIGESLKREQAVASLAGDLVKHNKDWIATVTKSDRMLDSLKQSHSSKAFNIH